MMAATRLPHLILLLLPTNSLAKVDFTGENLL